MTVEFGFKRSPAIRVASFRWSGPWSERRIRSEFERVERWALGQGLRTGQWVFLEPKERTWEVGVEVRGRARGGDGIRLRTFPATRVAAARFDPDVVAPHVIYHGLADWLRWRRKEKEIRSAGAYREVYAGNPWTNRKAWAQTEIQVVVR